MTWTANLGLDFYSYGLYLDYPYAYVVGCIGSTGSQTRKIVKIDVSHVPFSVVDSYQTSPAVNFTAWYHIREGRGALAGYLLVAGGHQTGAGQNWYARVDFFDKTNLAAGPVKSWTKQSSVTTEGRAYDAISDAAGTYVYWCGPENYGWCGGFKYSDLSQRWATNGVYSGFSTFLDFDDTGNYLGMCGSAGGNRFVQWRRLTDGLLWSTWGNGPGKPVRYYYTGGVAHTEGANRYFYLSGWVWVGDTVYYCAQSMTKFKSDGTFQWEQVYDDHVNQNPDEYMHGVCVDDSYVYGVGGDYAGPAQYQIPFTLRYSKRDLNGNNQWHIAGDQGKRVYFWSPIAEHGNYIYVVTYKAEYSSSYYGWLECRNKSDGAIAQLSTDTTPPTITAFSISGYYQNSRTISISAFTATDDTAVTGYMITQSTTPPSAGDAGWQGTAPTTYLLGSPGTTEGERTIYGWAKDAAGNVSNYASATCFLDTQPPYSSEFIMPETYPTLIIPITSWVVGDYDPSSGIAAYMIKVGAWPGFPTANDPNWMAVKPTTVRLPTYGTYCVWTFVKDNAQNVGSDSLSQYVTVDESESATMFFTIAATVTGLDSKTEAGAFTITGTAAEEDVKWDTGIISIASSVFSYENREQPIFRIDAMIGGQDEKTAAGEASIRIDATVYGEVEVRELNLALSITGTVLALDYWWEEQVLTEVAADVTEEDYWYEEKPVFVVSEVTGEEDREEGLILIDATVQDEPVPQNWYEERLVSIVSEVTNPPIPEEILQVGIVATLDEWDIINRAEFCDVLIVSEVICQQQDLVPWPIVVIASTVSGFENREEGIISITASLDRQEVYTDYLHQESPLVLINTTISEGESREQPDFTIIGTVQAAESREEPLLEVLATILEASRMITEEEKIESNPFGYVPIKLKPTAPEGGDFHYRHHD